MLDLLLKGGPVMIPIGLSALVATIIVVERFLFFRAVSKDDAILLQKATPAVREGRFEDAAALCAASSSPLARLLSAGIEQRDAPEADIKEAVMNAANREVPRLEKYISTLGTISNVATLLGLFGTVTGNIRAFGVLAASGAMGNPSLLAGAIAEALVTTAAGLSVSIPTIVFYNYFVSQANRTIIGMESSVGDLVILIAARKRNQAPANAAPAAKAGTVKASTAKPVAGKAGGSEANAL
jgi:biopolymer transport protein ExbB